MAITQESYVNDSSSVKAARKKLTDAKAALADAERAKGGLPASATTQLIAQVNKRLADAQAAVKTATDAASAAETKAKNYFTKNEAAINAKAGAKAEADIAAGKEDQAAIIARMKQAGLDTTAIEAQFNRKQAAATKASEPAADGGQKTPEQQPEDFAALLKTAPKFIREMDGASRKLLAQSLNDSFGLKLPIVDVYTDDLLAAYRNAIVGAQAAYKQFGDVFTVDQYLANKKLETAAIKAAGGGTGKTTSTVSISADTEAAGLIQPLFKSILGRDATANEIKNITKKLNDAEKKNPGKTKTDSNGNITYTGGINRGQFLTDLIKGTDEFKKKESQGLSLTANDIAETARLNGLKLTDSELSNYTKRIKAGEDIKVIENELRTIGSTGMPDSIKKMMAGGTNLDTIYSPYKRAMAASLDLDPNTIDLNDATLRSAIGPDKEMSLYDFNKAIRKDNRWKYSQEANDEVTAMINQVKRDFGFMG